MKLVNVNVYQIQVFVMINNVGIMINTDVNIRNWLTKVDVIKVSASECDKSWDVGKYLDYENCECRKKIIDKLVEERGENTDWNKMIHNATLNDNGKVCNSCTIYIALLVVAFSLISSVFFCANTGTVIYYYK